jgi:hypothetical protein
MKEARFIAFNSLLSLFEISKLLCVCRANTHLDYNIMYIWVHS